jgi:hypothetical protein
VSALPSTVSKRWANTPKSPGFSQRFPRQPAKGRAQRRAETAVQLRTRRNRAGQALECMADAADDPLARIRQRAVEVEEQRAATDRYHLLRRQ